MYVMGKSARDLDAGPDSGMTPSDRYTYINAGFR